MVKNIAASPVLGIGVLTGTTHRDERGFFREVYHKNELEEFLGYPFDPVQENHSESKPNVIRALHAENWNKLVYPVTGEIFIAIVDIRPDSANFGKYETFTVDSTERKALFIPKGFANSICVLNETTVEYIYLVDAYYNGSDTRAIAWDDPDINIPWPIAKPILSDRDRNNPRLRTLFPEKF